MMAVACMRAFSLVDAHCNRFLSLSICLFGVNYDLKTKAAKYQSRNQRQDPTEESIGQLYQRGVLERNLI